MLCTTSAGASFHSNVSLRSSSSSSSFNNLEHEISHLLLTIGMTTTPPFAEIERASASQDPSLSTSSSFKMEFGFFDSLTLAKQRVRATNGIDDGDDSPQGDTVVLARHQEDETDEADHSDALRESEPRLENSISNASSSSPSSSSRRGRTGRSGVRRGQQQQTANMKNMNATTNMKMMLIQIPTKHHDGPSAERIPSRFLISSRTLNNASTPAA